MSRLIESALAKGLDTKAVVMGVGVLPRTGKTFTDLFPGASAVLVGDDNTWGGVGEEVQASLHEAGVDLEDPIIYPGTPTLFADDTLAGDLQARLSYSSAIPVSLASGSLNDLTKLASYRLGRSYLNVCTAASVDGYTSFGAAITVDGIKSTQECPAPRGIIVPLDIMAAAPRRLTATGYGDLIEKIPAGADWIVADELGLDPIDDYVWSLVQGPLRDALGDPAGLATGDLEAIEKLSEGLVMSGLAMQVFSSSRPASGAGHYFSHQWEMEGYGRAWEPPLSHGFKVGLGTVAMCALYEKVIDLDLTQLDIDARLEHWPTQQVDEARVRALQPNPVICEASVKQSADKFVDFDHARSRLELIRDQWKSIQPRIASQVLPVRVIEQMLRDVGAVHHPAQIHVTLPELRTKYYQAQTIRTRYTILDLLQETGLLNQIVDSLFSPGGYWHSRGENPN
ncbi:MAG: sn-glycerol-1-phosphate dehydrogenase [Propionibacteriaceae bacterium]|nr:sn-glycerol-1-phosphate dehydrogenase [Propionibacteriaceae bacterium]